MKKKCTAILPVFLLVSLTTTAAVAQDDVAKLTREIEAINAVLEKAALAGDYDTILAHHAEDAILCPDTHAPIRGREAMRQVYRKSEQEQVKLHAFSTTIDTLWTCGDRIYLWGAFGQSASSPRSPNPVAIHGSYFEICRRQADGRHLIEYLIWNLGFNPFEGDK